MKIKYFFITLLDIGFNRINGRIKFEIKKIIYSCLPSLFINLFFKKKLKTPIYKDLLKNFKISKKSNESFHKTSQDYSFTFLNQKKVLNFPINWNLNKSSQLWRFNLHYFDWAREKLEASLNNEKCAYENFPLGLFIEDWINFNKIGKGDGWHSYTISLRIRNWIILFRSYPYLITPKNIDSLWCQICWLNSHQEYFLGGNHFIENLISLIIGSLQFEGDKSKEIYNKSFQDLEKELDKQILNDGGHEERSASYHLLILERLVDLGLFLENIKRERPDWLLKSILKMTRWVLLIRLQNGNYPTFNDSPDISSSLDSVVDYSFAYLNQKFIKKNGIKSNLTLIYKGLKSQEIIIEKQNEKVQLINLPDTGWVIVRIGKGIEFIFKYGDSCPKHLPAHAHSDLLNVELYKNGMPIIIEAGTSIYGNNLQRYYERSGAAHNIFQLAQYRNVTKEKIKWIEPIQTWGNFRAARKAKVLQKDSFYLLDGTILLKGSHDAYHQIGVSYSRTIKLKVINSEKILIRILDEVICKKKSFWRLTWHLAPGQPRYLLNQIKDNLKKQYNFNYFWKKTSLASGFGKRKMRDTLQIIGVLDNGIHKFESNIII